MDTSPQSPTTYQLVGRDRELALLHDRLTKAHDGQGNLVLIAGEAGAGKTALTEALCQSAARSGARVFAGHCYDRIETPPYGPWLQIARGVESLPETANAPPVPRLGSATSRVDLFEQAREFLLALTAARPLVLVLEDLHWGDRASLDLLRFIAHGLGEMPLLLLVTYRDEGVDRRNPFPPLVPLLVREAPTTRVGLRALDKEAAQLLVRARHDLADGAVQRLAEYLIERTNGNALYITELLRSLEEEGLLDHLDEGSFTKFVAQAPVPVLLRQIVDERLSRLGDESAALLAIAAVVGQEVPLAVWEAVSPVGEEALIATAERAETAHLVNAWPNGQGIRFTHALIRDVLYEHVSALRRRRLHRQVAEALISLPAPDPDLVASHLERAGDERAAEWLVAAGDRAETAYALATAAQRYEAAVALLDAQDGDPSERGWLRLFSAALCRNDDRDRAVRWVEEALRLAAIAQDPGLSARAQALSGLLKLYMGDHNAAIANLAAAADTIDHLPSGTGNARRRAQQIDRYVNRGTLVSGLAFVGRFTEAIAQGEPYLSRFSEPATSAAELGTIADVHNGLSVAYAMKGEPERARRSYAAAATAYRASDNHVLALANLRSELMCAVLPYYADNLAERARTAAIAEQLAAWVLARGGHANPNLPRYTQIPLLVLEGEWREARQILEQPETTDIAMVRRVRPLYLGILARAQGDRETAWRCVYEPSLARPETEPGEAVGGWQQLQFQLLAAGISLDEGNLSSARLWLDLHRRWLDYLDAVLGRAEGEILEAEWHRTAGDAAQARQHAERALAHATNPRQPIALIAAHRNLGALETDAGNGPAAESHFGEALVLADACRAPYERALTLLARAELAVKLRGSVTAIALLDEVRTICAPMDARPALAHADRLLGELGKESGPARASMPYPAGLTTREVEVLRLVATGLTNAEIAERLFLSPNTVKVHVARILGKLELHNRAAATEFALRHGITQPDPVNTTAS